MERVVGKRVARSRGRRSWLRFGVVHFISISSCINDINNTVSLKLFINIVDLFINSLDETTIFFSFFYTRPYILTITCVSH